MEFFLAIALGIGTYHGLFDLLHLSDGFSTAMGWVAGLLTLVLSSYYEKHMEHKHEIEKILAKKEVKKSRAFTAKVKNDSKSTTQDANENELESDAEYDFFKKK